MTLLQSVPVLINSPPSLSHQTCENGAEGYPREMEAPGGARARSSGEESGSESDSKSSASFGLSS